MKGKILNYLVIIGVSIILLLGIVTTAVGQDNYKPNFNDKVCLQCFSPYVPLHDIQPSNDEDPTPVIGYLQSSIEVTKINDSFTSGDIIFEKITLDNNNYEFAINKDYLEDCINKTQNQPNQQKKIQICKIIKPKSSNIKI
ncbi:MULTISPECIES: hypothetical protein [Moorena]|uniref:Uncharacterized protein n=1 Tax=Moorena producens 3L TaxID=489825 RepID=F4XJC5_9CYAN|nr:MULTISPECIES: hypothetical protein [Moorena]EGJ35205.1 hypothetical protein LYNGBM3L_08710 [Moorena producens 3L]NEP30073.1 hypothetical protein [Moorena sp. SIO3B2]NEP69180.1 hypothetical protein [Moorena sp. SIO3A5]NEQ05799.1 hypothetical protein [Moorena sp. SIO4E2]NER89665.1 hypothetical protein [Moorena sp. SIO3A2]